MNYGVIGLFNGGKSYYCVRLMCMHIAKGGIVVTNIELELEEVAKVVKRPLDFVKARYFFVDPSESSDPFEWPRGDPRSVGSRRVMIVIDEAAEWFSSFEDRRALKRFFDWLRYTQKRGQDCYFIIHDPELFAAVARRMLHCWIALRNMEEWRIPKLGWKLPPPWRYEFHAQYVSKDKVMLKNEIHLRDRRIFKCYHTDALLGPGARDSKAVNPYDHLDPDDDHHVSPPGFTFRAAVAIAFIPYIPVLWRFFL